jgi:hypothetical protein
MTRRTRTTAAVALGVFVLISVPACTNSDDRTTTTADQTTPPNRQSLTGVSFEVHRDPG